MWRLLLPILISLASFWACDGQVASDPDAGGGDPVDAGGNDTQDAGSNPMPCVYPTSTEPMALNQAIAPYSWPEVRNADENVFPLSLEDAYCNTDENLDWSIFDYLLFVSIPAW